MILGLTSFFHRRSILQNVKSHISVIHLLFYQLYSIHIISIFYFNSFMSSWVLMRREVLQLRQISKKQKIDDTHFLTANLEILNYLRKELDYPSHNAITSTQAENFYCQLLSQSSLKQNVMNELYREYCN